MWPEVPGGQSVVIHQRVSVIQTSSKSFVAPRPFPDVVAKARVKAIQGCQGRHRSHLVLLGDPEMISDDHQLVGGDLVHVHDGEQLVNRHHATLLAALEDSNDLDERVDDGRLNLIILIYIVDGLNSAGFVFEKVREADGALGHLSDLANKGHHADSLAVNHQGLPR